MAEELFAEKGYDNASTNDIIAKIGIARGTLYHHFSSKEEILDAIIDRMTRQAIAGAKAIVNDKDMPVLEKVAKALLAINISSGAKDIVMEQMHKPQNALLHQKMQEKLISGVVPLFAKLIEEGNQQGLFDAKYPTEASEMIMIYSNIAFDELENLTPKQVKAKGKAFIYNTERILGTKEGTLTKVLGPFFG